jgi:acyl-CoA synthetase (AMP-forming)/AMP-acid ligase II
MLARRTSGYWSEAITAFVALATEDGFGEKGIFEMCKTEMAPHKVPKAFVAIGEMPATSYGRVIQRQLREYNLGRVG